MKKITLFLMSLFLCVNYLGAQENGLPTPSSDNSGPWYYIQVKGGSDARANRVLSVTLNETKTSQDRVMGVEKDAVVSLDDIYSRLWRFEDTGNGTYTIVNRKNADKALDFWFWSPTDLTGSSSTKWINVVNDAAVASDWKLEAADDNPGYYKIIANIANDADPEEYPTTSPYLHQGNSSWNYGLIMEISQWGNGNESYFRFVEYPGDPELTVTKEGEEHNFGYGMEGDLSSAYQPAIPTLSITVFGFPTTGGISYSIDNEDNFWVTEDTDPTWGNSGGKLTVWYYPGEVGVQTGTLTISMMSADGLVEKKVDLKGTALPKLPVAPSPSIETGSNDTWYYILSPKRTGNYMKDYGIDEMLGTVAGIDKEDPGHLWKFVPVAGKDDAFYLVSKLGNQLEFGDVDFENTDTGETTTRKRFSSAATSENTFTFLVRNDGNYQLRWNENQAEVEGVLVNQVTYLNKVNPSTDDGYGISNSLTDVGNALLFSKYGSADYLELVDAVEFSTADAPIWYIVQFQRVSSGQKFKSNGLDNNITQNGLDFTDKASFLWRFEGNTGGFQMFDYKGNAVGNANGGAIAKAVDPAEGALLKFAPYMDGDEESGDWMIVYVETSAYLNDSGGSAVCGYGGLDNGARIYFLKTGLDTSNLAINNITPEDANNGEIVATVYYTLQGIQLAGTPTTEGLYIVKATYANGKSIAKTIYLTK